MTTGELVRLGFHRMEVAAWAVEKLTERLLHGLYRDASSEMPKDQCLHIPVRYLGRRANGRFDDPAVITGAAALGAEEVPDFPLPCSPLVLVDEHSRVRTDTERFSTRRVDLETVPVEHVRGTPMTPPSWSTAYAGLDSSCDDASLRRAVDELRWRRRLCLSDAVEDWGRLRHVGAERLLDMYDAGTFDQESDGERDAYRLLFEEHPPLPDCQVVLVGKLRVDFVFLSAMLVIEYHGRPHDGRTEEDATRRYALESLGFRVIVVTKSMLRDAGGLARFIHTERIHREQLVAAGAIPRAPLPTQPPRRLPLRTLHPLG